MAAVLAAAAKRRQEIAFELQQLEADFLSWMRAIVADNWQWQASESLSSPPSVEEFTGRLHGVQLTLDVFTSVRETFIAKVDEARSLCRQASVLERVLDASTVFLFQQ